MKTLIEEGDIVMVRCDITLERLPVPDDNRQPTATSMEMDAAVTSFHHYVYFLLIQYMQAAGASSGIPPLSSIMIAQSPWNVVCVDCSLSDFSDVRSLIFSTCSCIGNDSVAAASTWMRYMIDILNKIPADSDEVVILTHDTLLLSTGEIDRGMQTAILAFCRHFEQSPLCGKIDVHIACALTSKAAAGEFVTGAVSAQHQAVTDIVSSFSGLHISFIDCSRIQFDNLLRDTLQRRLLSVNAILALPSAQALHASLQLCLRAPSLDANQALRQTLRQINQENNINKTALHFTLLGRLSRHASSMALNPICYRGGAILVSPDSADAPTAVRASNRCIYRALQKSISSRDELLLVQIDAEDREGKPMKGVSAYGVLVPPLLIGDASQYHGSTKAHPDMVLLLLTDRESHIVRSNCDNTLDEETDKEASLLKEYIDQALMQVPTIEQYNPLAYASGRYMTTSTSNTNNSLTSSSNCTAKNLTAVYRPNMTQPFLRDASSALSVSSPPSTYKKSTVPLATVQPKKVTATSKQRRGGGKHA